MFGFKRFDVLVALYVFGIMVVELMGAKTFPIAQFGWLHLNASVAVFALPLLFTLTDVVTEVHGRARARSLVRIGLLIVVLQVTTAALFTALPSSAKFAWGDAAYDTIFGTSIRFGLASIAAFAVAELLDVAVFAKLRQKMGKHGLWVRNNVSNFLSQFVDGLVWTTIAFYAFGQSLGSNAAFILGIIIPYWLVRCALSLAETPLVYIGVRWLRKDKQTPAVAVQES
jgi:queuosine precursor transporter